MPIVGAVTVTRVCHMLIRSVRIFSVVGIRSGVVIYKRSGYFKKWEVSVFVGKEVKMDIYCVSNHHCLPCLSLLYLSYCFVTLLILKRLLYHGAPVWLSRLSGCFSSGHDPWILGSSLASTFLLGEETVFSLCLPLHSACARSLSGR